ncbi:MAG TPA: hypothetical protein VFG79_15305 [Solirubrobacter sp.]|jgi:hypothetical protein|nr:hypothetical protein [Solirubrobacter sp.]
MGEPETEELRVEQVRRERAEREQAREAEEPTGEHTHARRADKHAYLREKLADRERSERENG